MEEMPSQNEPQPPQPIALELEQQIDLAEEDRRTHLTWQTWSSVKTCFVGTHIPPFRIKTSQDFFKEENYHNFTDVLLQCGRGLVEMDLEIPKDGGSMPFLFAFSSQLSLPILTSFTVRFAEKRDDDDASDSNGNNTNSIYLIQSILKASHNSLKQLAFHDTEEEGIIPNGLEYLTLPVAITALYLRCQMKSKDLKILLNNSLPNLKTLVVTIPETPFDDGLITQILEAFSEKLENVYFICYDYDRDSNVQDYFKLPVTMKNLEELSLKSTHLELENDLCHLESSLPEMNELTLKFQTISMFRKWTDNSKFIKVTTFTVSLVDADYDSGDENYYVNVDVEIMQCLHLAFPNVKTLEITVCGAEMNGLEYLFLEMKQLEDLEIHVRRTENLVNSDFWDSLLIGVGVEITAFMRTTPKFSESFEIKDLSSPSIRNLSKLRAFRILTEGSSSTQAAIPLISDSVFHFGFFKMPNLMTLTLGGRFLASKEISEMWRAKAGKKITYKVEQ